MSLSAPFVVAIVGRPNVGKSTLFNLVTSAGKAVVHPTAGTTRDVRRVPARLLGLEFELLDTAGLEEGATGLAGDMNRLTLKALEGADVVLFMVDGKAGVLPSDRSLAQKIRKLGKPIILLVNKGDVGGAEDVAEDAARLGLGEPVLISAAHNKNLEGVYDRLIAAGCPVPVIEADEEEEDFVPLEDGGEDVEIPVFQGPIKLAIVGKPNAGKSTLVNSLLREERMLTGPMAGLTREAIATPFTFKGQAYELMDTPGLRKKAKVVEDLEGLMVGQAITAIQKADAVVLLVDASMYSVGTGKWKVFESQDAKIADVIVGGKKPLIVALNKWDLVEDKQSCLEDAAHQLNQVIHSIHTVKIVPVSALEGQGVAKVMREVADLMGKLNLRVSTSKLNKLLAAMIARRPPPLAEGKAVKLKFATQIKTNPPMFAFWGNRVSTIPPSYKMYLRNQLVDALGLENLPVHVVFKGGDNPYSGKAGKGATGKGSSGKGGTGRGKRGAR